MLGALAAAFCFQSAQARLIFAEAAWSPSGAAPSAEPRVFGLDGQFLCLRVEGSLRLTRRELGQTEVRRGQVRPHATRRRIARAERFLLDLQGALEAGDSSLQFGDGVVATPLGIEDHRPCAANGGPVGFGLRDVPIIGREFLFADRQRAFDRRRGSLGLLQMEVQHADVVERLGRLEIIGPTRVSRISSARSPTSSARAYCPSRRTPPTGHSATRRSAVRLCPCCCSSAATASSARRAASSNFPAPHSSRASARSCAAPLSAPRALAHCGPGAPASRTVGTAIRAQRDRQSRDGHPRLRSHIDSRLAQIASNYRTERQRGSPSTRCGEDVALDLRRAGEDRRRAVVEVRARERPRATARGSPAPAEAVAPSTSIAVSCMRWLISLQKSFTKRALRPGRRRGAAAVSVRQLLSLVISTSMNACASRWRIDRVAGGARRARQRQQVVEQHAVDDELARRGAALVGERRAGRSTSPRAPRRPGARAARGRPRGRPR